MSKGTVKLFGLSLAASLMYSSFAYEVKEVESKSELRSFLKKALQSGKKVYLYGGLTPGIAVQHMFDLSNTFNVGYNWK